MPTHPRSYSPAAAEKLRRAHLALAAAATAVVAAPGCTISGARPQKPIDDIPLGGIAPPADPIDWTPPPALVPLAPKEGFSIHVVAVEDIGLRSIAKSQGIDFAALLAANPQIDDPDYIRVGQQIYVPDRTAPTREPRVAGAPVPPPRTDDPPVLARTLPPKDGFSVYTVQPGDTLSAIAQRHEVLQKSIVQANDIADPNRIRAGQQLYIPTEKDPVYKQRTGGMLVPVP